MGRHKKWLRGTAHQTTTTRQLVLTHVPAAQGYFRSTADSTSIATSPSVVGYGESEQVDF